MKVNRMHEVILTKWMEMEFEILGIYNYKLLWIAIYFFNLIMEVSK